MDIKVPFENEYIFGNTILESIPHPEGFLGDVLNYITILCHYMGGVSFWIVFLPLVYLFYNRNFAIKIAVALFSTGIINGLFKFFFQSPRPSNLSPQFTEIQKYVTEGSFGLPSGHSHVSILVWGLVFVVMKPKWIKALALFFVLFTPFTRMYAGVHYPGDVIVGFSSGLISLLILLWFFRKYPEFPDPQSWTNPETKVKHSSQLVFALTLSTILLQQSVTVSIQHIHSLEQIVTAAGSLAGFWTGLVILKYYFPEWSKDGIGKNSPLFTILFLTIGLLVLYLGLGMIGKEYFETNNVYRYIRYFLVNFYIVLGIPYLLGKFQKV